MAVTKVVIYKTIIHMYSCWTQLPQNNICTLT